MMRMAGRKSATARVARGEETEITRRRSAVLTAALLALLAMALLPVLAFAQSLDELVRRGVEAGADVDLLTELRARADGAGLDAAATVRLLAPGVELAERDLPSRAVLQKGLEGVSKGVPADRIAAVQARLRGAMERAAGLVDPWLERPGVRTRVAAGAGGEAEAGDGARATVVEGVGLALAQGAPEEALRALLDRLPEGVARERIAALEVAVGAEVLADLPLATTRPGLAADVVASALEAGFGPAELRELPAAMQAAERRGDLPADAVARAAIGGMQADLPARDVLDGLFQGGFPGNVPFELPPGMERARERVGGSNGG